MDLDLGQIAGLLALLGYVPYIATILLRKTVPNRATWFIWATLGGIVAMSYWASGASNTLWVAVSHFVGQSVIALLSIRFGEGGWTSLDRLCLFGTAISLLSWLIFSSPLAALTISLIIDLLGAIPTLRKSFLEPEKEDLLTWGIFLTASTLNLLIVGQWKFSLVSYPLYLFLLHFLIITLILRPKIFHILMQR
jgi:hypothetical protein